MADYLEVISILGTIIVGIAVLCAAVLDARSAPSEPKKSEAEKEHEDAVAFRSMPKA